MVKVVLPFHLQSLAGVSGEVCLHVSGSTSLGSVMDALEAEHPVLKGTIREHGTLKRRPFVRFFADGQDISFQPPDHALSEAISSGKEPLLVIGAIAGG